MSVDAADLFEIRCKNRSEDLTAFTIAVTILEKQKRVLLEMTESAHSLHLSVYLGDTIPAFNWVQKISTYSHSETHKQFSQISN